MPSELIELEIRQDHIDKGNKGDCENCPFALSLKELFPGAHITVGDANAVITPSGLQSSGRNAFDFEIDIPGQDWIANFDEVEPEEPVIPGKFYLVRQW